MDIFAIISTITAPMDCFYIPGKSQRIQVGFRLRDRNDSYIYLDFYDEDMKILEDYAVNDAVTCSFGINFYKTEIGVVPYLTGYNLHHVKH